MLTNGFRGAMGGLPKKGTNPLKVQRVEGEQVTQTIQGHAVSDQEPKPKDVFGVVPSCSS